MKYIFYIIEDFLFIYIYLFLLKLRLAAILDLIDVIN